MNRFATRQKLDPKMMDAATRAQAPEHYVVQAALVGVDAKAAEMERRWGIGRLRLIVSDLLRAKFDRQRDLLDAAIEADSSADVETHAAAMIRAYDALDRSARENGHKHLAPEVWEVVLPASGEVVAIVRTEADAHHAARHQTVYTLADIAQLIDGLPDAVDALKKTWPAGRLRIVSRPPCDFDGGGDPIPF